MESGSASGSSRYEWISGSVSGLNFQDVVKAFESGPAQNYISVRENSLSK